MNVPNWADKTTVDSAPSSTEPAPRQDDKPLAKALFVNRQTFILAHPVSAIGVGFLVFFTAVIFPPDLYTDLLGDKNYMFLDARMIAFNCACIISLVGGIYFASSGSMMGQAPPQVASRTYSRYPITVRCVLLCIVILNVLSIYYFVRVGGISSIVASISGRTRLGLEMDRLREVAGNERWKALLNLSSVVLPAAVHFARTSRRWSLIWWLMVIALATYFPAALLTAKRNFLIRPMFGFLLLFLVWPPQKRIYSRQQAIALCVCLGITVVTMFLGLSVLRKGIDGTSAATGEVVRYLLGSYNTESLIVAEQLEMPGRGKGLYWTQWFWEFPFLGRAFQLDHLRDRLLGDSPLQGHLERTPILEQHGLTIGTAIPAFACTFVDFGWLGPAVFFPLGILTAIFWRSFLKQNPAGLILYPHAAYAFVEFRGNLIFPSYHTGVCLLILMGISLLFAMEGTGRQGDSGAGEQVRGDNPEVVPT